MLLTFSGKLSVIVFRWSGFPTLIPSSGIFTFLVDAYPLYAASALAANSFARSSFAAAFPLFGDQSKLIVNSMSNAVPVRCDGDGLMND